MLGEKIREKNVEVYLVNTGWQGGPYGVGQRIGIDYTRSIVRAAIRGALNQADYRQHPIFGFQVPKDCENVPREILWPENTWEDKTAYRRQAKALAQKFAENFSSLPKSAGELVDLNNAKASFMGDMKRS